MWKKICPSFGGGGGGPWPPVAPPGSATDAKPMTNLHRAFDGVGTQMSWLADLPFVTLMTASLSSPCWCLPWRRYKTNDERVPVLHPTVFLFSFPNLTHIKRGNGDRDSAVLDGKLGHCITPYQCNRHLRHRQQPSSKRWRYWTLDDLLSHV